MSLLSILMLPFQLMAYEAPESADFKGIYELRLSEVPFGKMGIEIGHKPSQYNVTSDITFTGLLDLLVRHSSHTTVAGGARSDITYESRYRTRNKRRAIKMVFREGMPVEEQLDPPENPAKRTPVPAEMKKNAYDPLTYLLKIRQSLKDAQETGAASFILKVYDGRRLTETHFTLKGNRVIRHNGKKLPVIALSVTRKPLAGFTAKELRDYNPDEAPLAMYYTNDDRLIPVRLEVPYWLGTLSATLIKECSPGESCLLGIRE